MRTITVNASQHVPMLFMRVLGISQSTVAATAQVTVRFVNMMLVVDRSGRYSGRHITGLIRPPIVDSDLHEFVDPSDGSPSPYFSDGRDNIGMVSFGYNWKLDFPLSLNFQSGTPELECNRCIDWILTTVRIRRTDCSMLPGTRQVSPAGRPQCDRSAHGWQCPLRSAEVLLSAPAVPARTRRTRSDRLAPR